MIRSTDLTFPTANTRQIASQAGCSRRWRVRFEEFDMIDEQSRRRTTFRGDHAVVLCDGQTWFLPFPRIRFKLARQGDGCAAQPVHSFGLDYLDKVEAFYKHQGDDSATGVDTLVAASLDLAVSLLLQNYDLAFEEAAELIQFDYGVPVDETNKEMRKTIIDCATGVVPKKASPDGPGSS